MYVIIMYVSFLFNRLSVVIKRFRAIAFVTPDLEKVAIPE